MRDYTFDIGYLTRLRARDSSTLAHFCDFFYLPVRNKARHKCRRWQDADDLVHDVFVAALKRIDAGEPEDPAKLPSYIFGICSKMLLRLWSEEPVENVVDLEAVDLKEVGERVDIRLENEFEARMLRQALKEMPPKPRDVIDRVYLQEQDRADVASEYGVSQANLRLILFRALKRLRGEWDRLARESKYERSSRQSRQQPQKDSRRKRKEPRPRSLAAQSETGD